MDVKDKVAVVTGGAQGIGEAMVRAYAGEGAHVVVADMAVAKAEALARELGGKAMAVRLDVRDQGSVDAMVKAVVARLGGIDILVNNAAIFSTLKLKPFEQIGVDEWRKVMDVNIMGVALCCRACVPHMRKAGGGRIINLASGAPLKGVPLFLHYISSKGAVIAMTRGLARELGKDGITVNAIAPGPVETELFLKNNPPDVAARIISQTAVGRAGTTGDVARAVLFFADPDNGFVTGQVLHVCGGTSLTVNW